VTTGFTLYLLPKVQGNNIYLQISSTLSSLVSLETFTSGSGSSQNSIKGPIVTQKRFNQRSLVPSNATLVIAGFKQLTNKANNSSLFGVDQLGGYGGSQDNIETIILITPSIINLKEQ
jgi:type II secretory pathway component GspD/PulD (secretin)